MTFRAKFKQLRMDNRRTFREIAGYCGKSIAYLADIEAGRIVAPDTATVCDLEKFFKLAPGTLERLAAPERENNDRERATYLVRNNPQLARLVIICEDLPSATIKRLLEKAS